jgi:predicted dinucleotide-binding enzyme
MLSVHSVYQHGTLGIDTIMVSVMVKQARTNTTVAVQWPSTVAHCIQQVAEHYVVVCIHSIEQ